MALRRDMENGSANPHFLGVEGVLLAEPDLIEWFTGWPEGLKYLVVVNNMVKQERHHGTHISEDLPILEDEERVRVESFFRTPVQDLGRNSLHDNDLVHDVHDFPHLLQSLVSADFGDLRNDDIGLDDFVLRAQL